MCPKCPTHVQLQLLRYQGIPKRTNGQIVILQRSSEKCKKEMQSAATICLSVTPSIITCRHQASSIGYGLGRVLQKIISGSYVSGKATVTSRVLLYDTLGRPCV